MHLARIFEAASHSPPRALEELGGGRGGNGCDSPEEDGAPFIEHGAQSRGARQKLRREQHMPRLLDVVMLGRRTRWGRHARWWVV